MITIEPVSLSQQERKALQQITAFHGSLLRLRSDRFMSLAARFSFLLLMIKSS